MMTMMMQGLMGGAGWRGCLPASLRGQVPVSASLNKTQHRGGFGYGAVPVSVQISRAEPGVSPSGVRVPALMAGGGAPSKPAPAGSILEGGAA